MLYCNASYCSFQCLSKWMKRTTLCMNTYEYKYKSIIKADVNSIERFKNPIYPHSMRYTFIVHFYEFSLVTCGSPLRPVWMAELSLRCFCSWLVCSSSCDRMKPLCPISCTAYTGRIWSPSPWVCRLNWFPW